MAARHSSVHVLAMLLGMLLLVQQAGARPQGGSLSDFQKHYERGISLYKSGQYAAAIPEMNAAYEIKQLPRLLYNLGQAHRRLGHGREAVRYYELYLRVDTDIRPRERTRVEQLIASTRAMLTEPFQPSDAEQKNQQESVQAQQPVPRTITEVPPPPPPVVMPERLPLWGKAAIGVSVALVGIAAITGASALGVDSQLQNSVFQTGADFTAQQATVRNLALATDIIGSVGIAALATTLIVTFTRRHASRERLRAAF